MTAIVVETERLIVREFGEADLDEFAALCADREVMRYVGDGTPLARHEVARWIEVCTDRYATRGYGTSAVFERDGGRFVGYCGVVRATGNDFDELIYVFGRDAWGEGYATEAGAAMLAHVFERSDLDRIWATIDTENEPSLRVAAKLGFEQVRVVDEDGGPVAYLAVDRPA